MSVEAPIPEVSSRPFYVRAFAFIHERAFPEHFTDELTGLGNRVSFDNELATKIERNPGDFALIEVDLDGLKEKNDTLGHAVGDELLITAANSISRSIRTENDPEYESDERVTDQLYRKRSWLGRLAVSHKSLGKVFRWGGDEYFAILHGVNSQEDLDKIVERVNTNLLEDGAPGSVGGALHESGMTGDQLKHETDMLTMVIKDAKKEKQRKADIANASFVSRALYAIGTAAVRHSKIPDRRRR
jgi:GGDEF domain-containing protein